MTRISSVFFFLDRFHLLHTYASCTSSTPCPAVPYKVYDPMLHVHDENSAAILQRIGTQNTLIGTI